MPPKGKAAPPEVRAKIAAGLRRAYAEGRHPRGRRGTWQQSEATRGKISASHLWRSALVREAERLAGQQPA